jgi:hypothetical protein
MSRPCGGGSGRCAGKQFDGCAAATALRNSASSRSRDGESMFIPGTGLVGSSMILSEPSLARRSGLGDGGKPETTFGDDALWKAGHTVAIFATTEKIMATDDTTELEAAVYRRLVEHLRSRTDVQNIELMNLAGFCRNCLSNWMKEAADAKGMPMTKEQSREVVYGMPYDEWRAKFQKDASATQKAAFEKASQKH